MILGQKLPRSGPKYSSVLKERHGGYIGVEIPEIPYSRELFKHPRVQSNSANVIKVESKLEKFAS